MQNTIASKRTVAVIGTAGRDKAIPMTNLTWEAMAADLRQRISPTDTLVSGGAAWADHLAVHAYLQGWCAHLILRLPAPYQGDCFVGPPSSSASTANYYHHKFSEAIGRHTLDEIGEAITKGCTFSEELPLAGYGGMFARNKIVAQEATACIAYTFGEGSTPADGGTLNTWSQIASPDKVHVPIGALLSCPAVPDSGIVFFCKTKDPYGELSNMFPSPLVAGGKVWPAVENLYQAQKFGDPATREKIRLLTNPMAAAYEGRNRANVMRPDWDQVKDAKMLACLRLKYEQHPSIKALLLATGERCVAELSYKDSYWGTRPDMSGLNRLGQLHMQLRREFNQP